MSRIYDNWERLVQATLKREQYYQLCRAHSRTPSVSSLSSDFTFPSPAVDSPSPAKPSFQSHSTHLAQPLPKRVFFNSYRFNFFLSLKAKIKSFQSSYSSDQPEQNKPELRKSFSKRRRKLHHRSNSFSGDISSASKQSEFIDQEVDKRLKVIEVDEPSNDLESLRRILEAMQVKGLLHSAIPHPDRNVRTGRSSSPTTGDEGNAIGGPSNPLVKTKPLSVETQRRVSSVQSPTRRNSPAPTVNNRSPRSRKTTASIYQKEKITTVAAAEDESYSIYGRKITTSTDTEDHENLFNSGDSRKHFHGGPLTHRREWNISRPIRTQLNEDKVTGGCDLFNFLTESYSSIDEICSLFQMTGWGDFNQDMSTSVFDIERLIFSGLISEMIGDFATITRSTLSSSSSSSSSKTRTLSSKTRTSSRRTGTGTEPHRQKVGPASESARANPIHGSFSSTPNNRRTRNNYSPSYGRNQVGSVRRSYSTTGEFSPTTSPLPARSVRTVRSSSPTTGGERDAIGKRSNSLVKPKPLSVETQRRVSSVQSPKLSPRRNSPDPTDNNRSPRSKRTRPSIYQKEKITTVAAGEDESSSISGSSITTSTDTERPKTEELKEGRSLLERCDKLLHSIAEMAANDAQPSPVSVLDSLTPSPVTTKRIIDFKDISCELEYETWRSPPISPIRSKPEEKSSRDCDYEYISDILRASHYLSKDSNMFLLLEKQQYLKGKDISKASRVHRKLIFDIINEILDRNKRLPAWKINHKPSLDKVWSEFLRIREMESGNDLFESVCGVLKKVLDGNSINDWRDCHVEMSDAILDIERLIFKDVISETIRDLAE